jgi:hypothetical protein
VGVPLPAGTQEPWKRPLATARRAEFWSRAVIVPAAFVVPVGGWVAVESAQGELVPLVAVPAIVQVRVLVDVLLYRITQSNVGSISPGYRVGVRNAIRSGSRH